MIPNKNKATEKLRKEPDTDNEKRRYFYKTHKRELNTILKLTGSKKAQVIATIISELNTATNVYVTTIEELAKKSGVTNKTVHETLKALENKKIISRKSGSLMVNPKLLCYGNEQKMIFLMHKFQKGEWN